MATHSAKVSLGGKSVIYLCSGKDIELSVAITCKCNNTLVCTKVSKDKTCNISQSIRSTSDCHENQCVSVQKIPITPEFHC